jgi:hypothetical protein
VIPWCVAHRVLIGQSDAGIRNFAADLLKLEQALLPKL